MSIDKIKWILYNDYKKHKSIKIKYICFAFKYWTRVLNQLQKKYIKHHK